MKVCRKCGVKKVLTEFYREPHRGGLRSQCKECMKIRGRGYHGSHRAEERVRLRDWREKNPEKARAQSLRNLEKHKEEFYEQRRLKARSEPEKSYARNQLNYAIKTGKVARKVCGECGNEKAEGHHPDYSKPLEVQWLCRRHHLRHHANSNI